MSDTDLGSSVRRRYTDLSLDLNLDQVTADEAWNNYENIQLKYTLEVRFVRCAVALVGIWDCRPWTQASQGERRPSSFACVRGTSPGEVPGPREEADSVLLRKHTANPTCFVTACTLLARNFSQFIPFISECLYCFQVP